LPPPASYLPQPPGHNVLVTDLPTGSRLHTTHAYAVTCLTCLVYIGSPLFNTYLPCVCYYARSRIVVSVPLSPVAVTAVTTRGLCRIYYRFCVWIRHVQTALRYTALRYIPLPVLPHSRFYAFTFLHLHRTTFHVYLLAYPRSYTLYTHHAFGSGRDVIPVTTFCRLFMGYYALPPRTRTAVAYRDTPFTTFAFYVVRTRLRLRLPRDYIRVRMFISTFSYRSATAAHAYTYHLPTTDCLRLFYCLVLHSLPLLVHATLLLRHVDLPLHVATTLDYGYLRTFVLPVTVVISHCPG